MEGAGVPGSTRLALPAADSARGRLLAVGGILLAAAVFMINLRLSGQWAHGTHFVVALAAFLVVFGLGALVGVPLDRPPAYQSALLITGLVLLVLVLPRLAQVIGVDNAGNTGTLLWMAAIFTLFALLAAMRYRSAACALLAAFGLATVVLTAVDKIFDHPGLTTFRWFLLVLVIGFAVGAVVVRGARGRLHSAQFVNAAGFTLLALGFTFATGAFNRFSSVSQDAPGFGWKLVLIVGALAILGYALVDRARGPGYVGFFALLIAVVVISRPKVPGEGSIVGWPLIFLLLAGAALALGLMPRGPRGGDGAGVPAVPPPEGGQPPTFVARPDAEPGP
jgi:hypothetical protein